MAEIPNNIKRSLNLFLQDIQSICSLDKVILYGSFAKGKESLESDIDLAIFSKTATDKNRLSLMSKMLAKVSKYKLDFQPLVFSFKDYSSTDNAFIQQEIKNKGISLK
ncbi:nucleotidyltransferase domain-containing protein [Candidatus Saganbacteria bacterium]|nr:nucleotidyltransferase domain-containing protein [Candidatus Saganbacteria bacterium]